ncbi:hypothetical protein ACI2OX_18280 [Bacillus sp. N9]
MSCGVSEYWIVNPDNQEVTIYQFEENNINQYSTFKKGEIAQSFIFERLRAEIDSIFRL